MNLSNWQPNRKEGSTTEMEQGKKMGRPYVYDPSKPRRQRGVQLTDELWEALVSVAGNGKVAQYLEERLREIPEVAEAIERGEGR